MGTRILTTAVVALAVSAAARGQSVLFEQFGTDPDDRLGHSVAGGVDFDNDGWDDVVVGAPYHDSGGLTDNGTVWVVSGQDGSTLHIKIGDADDDHFGAAVAIAGDVNNDTVPDVIVGAPNALNGGLRTGMARVFSGLNSATIHTVYGDAGGDEFGFAVAGGFDQDSDGFADFVVGAPNAQMLGAAGNHGGVRLLRGIDASLIRDITGPLANSRYGSSVSVNLDFDSDGDLDVAFGGPGSGGTGVVRIFGAGVGSVVITDLWGANAGDLFGTSIDSGIDLNSDGYSELLVGAPGDSAVAAEAGSVVLYDGLSRTIVRTWSGTLAFDRLGTSVAVIGDVGGNGQPEFATGATEAGTGAGSVRVFSTNALPERYRVSGEPGSEYGHTVGAAGDFNADGVRDFVTGGPLAEDPTDPLLAGAGVVRVHSGGGAGIVAYCTAGTSASGCQASLGATGTPSATAINGFFLGAIGVEGNKNGIFFYGANGRQANPWGNGTSLQCVVPPVKRGGLLPGNGTSGACDGWFLQDLNARWCPTCPKPSHNFGAGAVVQAQLWFRDPLNTSNQTTSLSNALEFVITP